MPREMWDEITYPFPNFNGATVEIWEWMINFIPHYIMDVFTPPCWDLGWSKLVKGPSNVGFSLQRVEAPALRTFDAFSIPSV